MLKLLQSEYERCVKALPTMEPGTEEYRRAIDCLGGLRYEADTLTYRANNPDWDKPDFPCLNPKDAVCGAPAEEAAEEFEGTPAQNEEGAKSENTEDLMSKEEVLDILSPLAAKGVKVAKLLSDMGYSRLSEVPATKYTELVAKAKAAEQGGA